MTITLTINTKGVYLEDDKIPDDLVPMLAFHSKVVDKSQPDKLTVDFSASLQTAGIWRLPLTILKRLY